MSIAREIAEKIKALPPGCLVAEIEQLIEPLVLTNEPQEALALIDRLDPVFILEGRHAGRIQVVVEFRGDDYAAMRVAQDKILACVASTVGLRISVDQALAFCHLLRDRAAQMTAKEFHECLHRAIGANRDYCDNIRHHFQNNPAAFLAHRTPQTQSVELLKFMLSMPEL
jgi:hypothetical protein